MLKQWTVRARVRAATHTVVKCTLILLSKEAIDTCIQYNTVHSSAIVTRYTHPLESGVHGIVQVQELACF